MRRDPAALEAGRFDLVVIGGGIMGAMAALDAARRGLATALIERGDWAGATSAASFKMLHGGIRYLQHGDLVRLRQSALARRLFFRLAPHLVRPLPIALPTYGHGLGGRLPLRLAAGLHDLLTFDRDHGIADPARHMPGAASLSRAETLGAFPGLPAAGLTGAVVFHDGQMLSPPRLVLACAQGAAAAGAVVVNRLAAAGLLLEGGRVAGLRARDLESGGELHIRTSAVLNATGPFAEPWLATALGQVLQPPTRWSRDACLVVARPLLQGGTALGLRAASADPDALLSRGGRHLFVVPWQQASLLGVWHLPVAAEPGSGLVAAAEIRAWLDELCRAWPALDLGPDDIALVQAGLVPFGDNAPGSRDLRYGHRSRLVDHGRDGGPDGLVTLQGVRFTMAPLDSVRAVDLLLRRRYRQPPASRLTTAPLPGGAVTDLAGLERELAAKAPMLTAATVRQLVQDHGCGTDALLDLIRADPALARPLGRSPVIAAQIVHAVREEMALHLGDVLFRRTGLATMGVPGAEAVEDALRVMAAAAGWSATRALAERQATDAAFARSRSGGMLLEQGSPAAAEFEQEISA